MSVIQNLLKGLTGKPMIQGIVSVYSHGKLILAPLLSYGGFLAFLQVEDISNKPLWAAIGTIVIAIVSYLGIRVNAKTRVEVKQVETTASTDASRQTLTMQIFDRAMLDAERQRAHFTAELQQQREHFSNQLTEYRDHYERKEEELRTTYHDRLNEAGNKCDIANRKLITLEINLKNAGIFVSEAGDITLPPRYKEC